MRTDYSGVLIMRIVDKTTNYHPSFDDLAKRNQEL